METYPRITHHQDPKKARELEAIAQGAVNVKGELLRKNGMLPYPNLYIIDGSIIPTALGVNPSLTISALAFKILDGITKRDRGSEPPVKNPVREGSEYMVTFREVSKCESKTYTVATIDKIEGQQEESGSIAYVSGCHLPEEDPFDSKQYTGKVSIKKVHDRYAEAELISPVCRA